MAAGDMAFIYHTGGQPAIVGVATVTTGAYSDPTDDIGRWLAVNIAASYALPVPVSLAAFKADPAFAGWELVRAPRLSAVPVSPGTWDRILAMAGNKPRWG